MHFKAYQLLAFVVCLLTVAVWCTPSMSEMGMLAERAQDLEMAMHYTEAALAQNPDDYDLVARLAQLSRRRGRAHATAALPVLEDYLQRWPRHGPARRLLARQYQSLGRVFDAIALVNQTLHVEVANQELLLDLYEQNGDLNAAIAMLEMIIDKHGASVARLQRLARLCCWNQQPHDQAKALRRLVELQPEPLLWGELLDLSQWLGDRALACEAADQLMQAPQLDCDLLSLALAVYIENAAGDQAQLVAKRLAAQPQATPAQRLECAKIFYWRGDSGEALRTLQTIPASLATSPMLQFAASIAMETKDFQQAASLYERLAAFTGSAEHAVAAATSYSASGQTAAALAVLERHANAADRYPYLWALAGSIAMQLGDRARTRHWAERLHRHIVRTDSMPNAQLVWDLLTLYRYLADDASVHRLLAALPTDMICSAPEKLVFAEAAAAAGLSARLRQWLAQLEPAELDDEQLVRLAELYGGLGQRQRQLDLLRDRAIDPAKALLLAKLGSVEELFGNWNAAIVAYEDADALDQAQSAAGGQRQHAQQADFLRASHAPELIASSARQQSQTEQLQRSRLAWRMPLHQRLDLAVLWHHDQAQNGGSQSTANSLLMRLHYQPNIQHRAWLQVGARTSAENSWPSMGAGWRWQRDNLSVETSLLAGQPWDDSAKAILADAWYHQASLTASHRLLPRLSAGWGAQLRSYAFPEQSGGNSVESSLRLNVHLLERPGLTTGQTFYDSEAYNDDGLAYDLTLYTSWQYKINDQPDAAAALVPLFEQSQDMRVGLDLRLPLSPYFGVQGDTFVGMDHKRDLEFSELYGARLRLVMTASQRLRAWAGYEMVSESQQVEGAGRTRLWRFGVNWNF